MCSYPNLQLEDCVVTRTVNLLDVSRKKSPVRPMYDYDKNCQSVLSESKGTMLFSYVHKNENN